MTQASGEITNCEELRTAIKATDGSNTAHQRFLIKKSIDLGCIDDIPDEWGVEVENDG